MKDYVLDLKVFNSIPWEELPFKMPLDRLSYGNIPIGVHSIILNTTESQLDQLAEKLFEHSDVKLLGVHSLTI